jgi:NitT/TauT family transport system substrate-binding protein
VKQHITPSFRNHRSLIRLAGALSFVALCGCLWGCPRTDAKPAVSPEKITIAYSTATDAALAVVALVQGDYHHEGLEVTPHLYPYGKLALKDVLEGNADVATVAETPVMFEIMKGEKLSVIATIQTSSKDNAIVARKDRGIHSEGDLRGKRLAVTLGTTADFYLDVYLAAHGISRKELVVVDLKPEALPAALADGTVDAISTFNPYVSHAQNRLGDRGVTFLDEDLYTWSFNMVAKQEFILKNPEKVKKMLRALISAEEFAIKNPEKAQKNVADFSRLDMSLVQKLWANTEFQVVLDQSLVLAMEDESRWAIKGGLTRKTQVPNYLEHIYFDGLTSVKPDAVRILR